MTVTDPSSRANRLSAPSIAAIVLMLAIVGLPLPLGLLVRSTPAPIRETLIGAPLTGEYPVPRLSALTFDYLQSGDIQKILARRFTRLIYPRGLIVRLTNQVYFQIFSKSYALERSLLIGRDGVLFTRNYVEAYCQSNHAGPFDFGSLVGKIRTLHEGLARLGKPFVFVTSPSKAVTVPQDLPRDACLTPRNPAGGMTDLVAQLRAAGVPVVDGAASTRAMKLRDPIPPFPRGGIHWSTLVATRVAGSILAELDRRSPARLGTFAIGLPRWDASPDQTDSDLVTLLNLVWPALDYPTGHADTHCTPTAEGRGTTLVMVGGSFAGGLAEALSRCGVFRVINHYFYYDNLLLTYPGVAGPGEPISPGRKPVDRKAVDWRGILTGSTAIVVELNELFTSGGGPFPWLEPFLDDATAALR